ncbi:MAG: MFS transporter [Myxococcota bacterium]|nr:MFS transporter [Myxococcota bacterium]
MPSDLWRNRSYFSVWSASAISNLGSMVFTIALPLAAVTVLDAGPADIAAINIAGTLPGALLGLLAAAWIDRMPRLPLLRIADFLRAGLVGGLALSAFAGWLALWQMIAAAFGLGLLGFVFRVAQHALLPSIVDRARMVEANSKLRVADSVTEGVGFAGAGILIQVAGAPLAFLVDAVSYVLSAFCLAGVEEPPRPAGPSKQERSLTRELSEGVHTVLAHPMLRPLAIAQFLIDLGTSLLGVVYMLFAIRVLGLSASTVGVVAATGALSSFAGAWLAQATNHTWRPGLALVTGIAVLGGASLLIPAAAYAGVFGVGLLFLHQLGDGGWILYDIHATSLRQQAVPGALQGRVNGFFSVLTSVAALLGSLLGGILGEWFGLESTLWLAAGVVLAGAGVLALSRVRSFEPPAPDVGSRPVRE